MNYPEAGGLNPLNPLNSSPPDARPVGGAAFASSAVSHARSMGRDNKMNGPDGGVRPPIAGLGNQQGGVPSPVPMQQGGGMGVLPPGLLELLASLRGGQMGGPGQMPPTPPPMPQLPPQGGPPGMPPPGVPPVAQLPPQDGALPPRAEAPPPSLPQQFIPQQNGGMGDVMGNPQASLQRILASLRGGGVG